MYVSSGKKDASLYDAACAERDRLKEEITNTESDLNNILSRIYEADFRKHENEQASHGLHSKNLLNIAFIVLGLAFALFLKRLFS